MGIVGVEQRGVKRMVTAACVGGLLLGAVGCTAAPTRAPRSATPTVASIFASDEEALAAATEAYANYQEMSDQIESDGGVAPERIEPFVSSDFFPSALTQSEGFLEAGARSVGSTTFRVDAVQHMDYADPAAINISLYICDDVSGVDVVDEAGESLVSETRLGVTPFEVGFALTPEGILVVDSRDLWTGSPYC